LLVDLDRLQANIDKMAEHCGRPRSKDREGLDYPFGGDEFGVITARPGAALPRLGDRLEFFVTHCDPTANLYDRMFAVRGDAAEAAWPVVAPRG
jgi:D-serine deaminase-like pyridoxal phosphate-dependent protein